MAKLHVRARVLPDGIPFTVTGCEAKTLLALIKHGPHGVSGWSFPGGPPYRLAAYVCDLRHKFGVPIRMEWRQHEGGRHGCWFLAGEIELVPPEAAE